MTRYIIEGTWSGYTSAQRRVVHRTVHPSSAVELRLWALKTGAIKYTDGTRLDLSVRDAKPRERVQEIPGYTSLIADCCQHGVSRVDDLPSDKP